MFILSLILYLKIFSEVLFWVKKISSVIEIEEKVFIELNERDGGGFGFILSDRMYLKLVIDFIVNFILEFKIM